MRGVKALRGAAAALALGLAASSPALSPHANAQDATQLLRDAVNAYASNSFVGEVQNIDYGTKNAQAVLFRIEHRAPDTTRRWYLAPESLYGDSIISRGDTNYDVDTRNRRIVVVKDDALDDQIALDDNFGLLLHNYRAVIGENDDIAGRRAISVNLINKYTGSVVTRIALDLQTKLVLQRELYSPSGSVSHQMRFEQIHFTNAIPKEIFNVPGTYSRVEGPEVGTPSSNVEAAVRTAGFAALEPSYLPEGFWAIAGEVTDIKGIRSLHVMYSDGLRTISLFENARGAAVDLSQYSVHSAQIRSRRAQYVLDGPTTLMTWQQKGLHLALVGALSRDEMVRIASSVGH